MDLTNKLSKLRSENGVFKGGFTSLSLNQLDKLRGGSGTNYVQCSCNNNNCSCTVTRK